MTVNLKSPMEIGLNLASIERASKMWRKADRRANSETPELKRNNPSKRRPQFNAHITG